MLLPWDSIETVFLDMDGTLLDLRFDNYFWQEHLPKCYAQARNLPLDKAKTELFTRLDLKKGQLVWYCVDYWTQELDLPILQLKQEIAYLIGWRQHAKYFLQTIKHMNKKIVLITNAHPASLHLKIQTINITPWFDFIISSHDYGYPKEDQKFWQTLQNNVNFNVNNSLFIDDSLTVLTSAKNYGIKYLYAIAKPDSSKPSIKASDDFMMINDFIDCF